MKRAALVVVLAVATGALAQDLRGIILRPGDVRWKADGNHEVATIAGDPSDAQCPSVARIRLPGGGAFQVDGDGRDRFFTVISGAVSLRRAGVQGAQVLPAGGFWTVPSGGSLKLAADLESIIQVTALPRVPSCPAVQPVTLVAQEMRWMAFGLAQRAVLVGDADADGCPVVTRSRYAAGNKFPRHVHEPFEDRVFTMISGTVEVGFGPQWDDSALTTVHAPGVFTIPGGAGEFRTHSTDGELQREGLGPASASCKAWARAR